MKIVYFDGSIETCGHLWHACSTVDSRVHVVLPRSISDDHRQWLFTLQDCGGSLGHFERGRFVPHISVGSKRRHTERNDGVELFFQHLAERTDLSDDAKYELLRMMICCDHDGCGTCRTCRHVSSVAEDYGFYDYADWAATFSA